MTGATIIIFDETQVCLGKVRHSGNDVMRIFPSIIHSCSNPQQLWMDYLQERRSRLSDISLGAEICETDFDNGVCFSTPSSLPVSPVDIYRQLNRIAHDVIEETTSNEYEGYSCSYSDYELLINLDTQTIQRIGI